MCGYLQGLFEVYLMLLDWGKTCPCSSCGETGSSLLQTPRLQCLHGGKQGHCACFAGSQPWLDDLFASQTGRTGHFPPSMMIHFVRHGQAAGRCDCHSLSPVMSQPPSAGCETRAACRYLFIKPFAAVATFSQLCCLTPMGDPSFLPGEHQVSL